MCAGRLLHPLLRRDVVLRWYLRILTVGFPVEGYPTCPHHHYGLPQLVEQAADSTLRNVNYHGQWLLVVAARTLPACQFPGTLKMPVGGHHTVDLRTPVTVPACDGLYRMTNVVNLTFMVGGWRTDSPVPRHTF